MDDALVRLLPCAWRGVEVPVTSLRMTIAHDLVEHKYWRVDGGRIESTGVAPIRISATIPLHNGVTPGPTEHWNPQLYPGVMRVFVTAFADKSKGMFQHPEFGEIICKPERMELVLEAGKRTGMSVEASWVETLDDELAHNIVPSMASEVESITIELDADTNDPSLLIPLNKEFEPSWEQLGNSLLGAFDQISLGADRLTAPGARMLRRANELQDAIGRMKTALTWPLNHNAERAKSIANDAQQSARAVNAQIGVFEVPVDTTLAGVQGFLPTTRVSDLIVLNPRLVRSPVVKKGTQVRYRIAA